MNRLGDSPATLHHERHDILARSISRHRNLANLDALRSLAVIAVLVDHLTMLLASRGIVSSHSFAIRLGYQGVLAFFVHTSLVLMLSLERLPEYGRTVAFYIRRAFRIYPLAVLCVVVVVVFKIPAAPMVPGGFQTPSAPQIISNLFLIQSITRSACVSAPMWSLPFEVEMYVVLPFLYKLGSTRRASTYLAGLFLGFSLLGWIVYYRTGHANILAYVPCFLSGVVAYRLRRMQPFLRAAAWPFALILWFGLMSWVLLSPPVIYMAATWLATLCLGASIYCFRESTSGAWNRATETIARYSYGIYLCHLPVMWVVFSLAPVHNLVASVVLWLIGTLAAAMAAYHFVEAPLINCGKRISEGLLVKLRLRPVAAVEI